MSDGVVRWLRAASSVWSQHVRLWSLRCNVVHSGTTFSFSVMKVARAEGHDLLERHAGLTCPLLCVRTDVLLCVMDHLEPYDLCSVAQTCTVRTLLEPAHSLTTDFNAPVSRMVGSRPSEQRRLHLASFL
jgi:hypothetical protein